MGSRRLLPLVVLSCAGSLAAAACAPVATDAPGAETTEEGVVVTSSACDETNAPAWDVSLRDRACADVQGAGGAWRAEPIAPDAPSFCTMTWYSPRSAPADVSALQATVRQYVDVLVPSCSPQAAGESSVTEVPASSLDFIGMAGANGCDVCGYLRRDRLDVILPAERVHFKQLAVSLSDRTVVGFQLDVPAGVTRATITLPAPPDGASYLEGPVTIY